MTEFKGARSVGPASSQGLRSASLPVLLKASLEHALDDALPTATVGPPRLVEAMRYALLAPAKRARGVLACLVAHQFGAVPERAHPIAVAIEMVHAASLVLDDLPCMDDAELRRGRATTHRIYGEDTAALVAVGLMNQATLHLARDQGVSPALCLQLIVDLAAAIGPDGLVGGQEEDLRDVRFAGTTAAVEAVHRRKTGVLFSLAGASGARIADAGEQAIREMHAFGAALGLAFQTYDDVLDAHASRESAGKDVGKDQGKATVVGLLGSQRAKARADQHVRTALDHLDAAGGDIGPTRDYVSGLLDQLATRAPRISGG